MRRVRNVQGRFHTDFSIMCMTMCMMTLTISFVCTTMTITNVARRFDTMLALRLPPEFIADTMTMTTTNFIVSFDTMTMCIILY